MITDTENSAPKSPIASVEQQEKFKLSIANWCLANEGLSSFDVQKSNLFETIISSF